METQLWDCWAAMVHAVRPVVGVEDAQDCASEALTQFLERRPDDVLNLEAFLVTLAKRRAVDHVRSRTRASARELRSGRDGALPVPDIAEEITVRAEAAWADAEARRLLAPHLYAVLQLVAEGLPASVIATRLGISEPAVAARILRARRKMRAALAQTLAVLGAGACAVRRWLTPAAATTSVVAAAFLVALLERPSPFPQPVQESPELLLLPGGGPVLADRDQVQRVAQVARTTAAQGSASPARRSVIPVPPPKASVQTPVGGVRLEYREDDRRSSGPVEQLQRCLEDLRVEVGYQGCGPPPER